MNGNLMIIFVPFPLLLLFIELKGLNYGFDLKVCITPIGGETGSPVWWLISGKRFLC